MAERVIVIGAGIVGIQSAHALARRGLCVTVVERAPAPAMLCSRANAGVVSIGHAEAWAGPDAPRTLLRAALGRDPGIKVSRWADPALIRWGLDFLRNCSAEAHDANSARLTRLCLYSRDRLPVVAQEAGLSDLLRHDGALYLLPDRAAVEAWQHAHSQTSETGMSLLSPSEIVTKDPALAPIAARFAGALFSPHDSVGDCHRFATGLGAHLGTLDHVDLRYETELDHIEREGGRIIGIRAGGERIAADHVILAIGVETPKLTRPLGFVPRIYPVKGYSGSWRLRDPARAPTLPYLDEAARLAVSSYSGILRITAMAEFAGGDDSLPEARLSVLKDYVARHFADLVDLEDVTFWTGSRPTTPASAPYLGRVRRFGNLWINAGHGALGWTASAGSAELLAKAITREERDCRDVSAQARWLDPL